MRSSYSQNKYDNVFNTITFLIRPKRIVEFGILDGFSLNCFLKSCPKDCQIEAYDLFEDFPFNHASYNDILDKFKSYDNLTIKKLDFYEGYKRIKKGIDILHVDIANTGDTFQFFVENYMPLLSADGVGVLEGGSIERDEYDWMTKYNKRKIRPYLDTLENSYDVMVLHHFPSLTLIRRQNDSDF